MNVDLPLLLDQPVLTPAQKALLVRAQRAPQPARPTSRVLAQLRRGRALLARAARRSGLLRAA